MLVKKFGNWGIDMLKTIMNIIIITVQLAINTFMLKVMQMKYKFMNKDTEV